MTTVTVAQGKLRGGEAKTPSGYDYYEFLEIPYAKPPIGDLRFKNPQYPESWEGERDATSYHNENIACQVDFQNGKLSGSEDCLYLNIFTPKVKTKSTLLPVMVYIHGGGFIYGSGTKKSECGPDYLIENEVVVVTINYRLGVLGFLSLDIMEAPGNMGLKDQVKALEWIQKNIENFGGDKNNVTIFGISAGSASVEYLMLSPLAKGLFHKAILQSGSALNDWAINFEYKQLLYQLLKELIYKGSTDDNQAIRAFLLKTPVLNLMGAAFQATETFTTKRIFFGFVPTIEKDFGKGDTFLSELPHKLLKEGRFNNVPVIRGFCDLEGAIMNMMKPFAVKELLDKKDFAGHWAYEFNAADKDKYNKKITTEYLDTIKSNDDFDKFATDFFGDLHFVAGIALSARLASSKNTPIYMYLFTFEGNLNATKALFGVMRKGASHGDDLGYLLRHTAMDFKILTESDIIARNRMTRMWTNFAKTCNPTPSKTEEIPVEWPVYTKESPLYLHFDQDLTIISEYQPKKLDIFEEIYEKYEK
ncbi:hypothetical protein K1T71_006238 [Dendrolimus kikuchii]|uniref:Uncharacterized protein n=1 Tax=Dendrolimus kikuchii TaxID=765133 RepID=A0ACC1D3S3_9NEOP|nr:hypothetical protein K1T71_006238 [Dendrolimus kikuchii]